MKFNLLYVKYVIKYNFLYIHRKLYFIFNAIPIGETRDEDPVQPRKRIRGSVPQTKGEFKKSIE